MYEIIVYGLEEMEALRIAKKYFSDVKGEIDINDNEKWNKQNVNDIYTEYDKTIDEIVEKCKYIYDIESEEEKEKELEKISYPHVYFNNDNGELRLWNRSASLLYYTEKCEDVLNILNMIREGGEILINFEKNTKEEFNDIYDSLKKIAIESNKYIRIYESEKIEEGEGTIHTEAEEKIIINSLNNIFITSQKFNAYFIKDDDFILDLEKNKEFDDISIKIDVDEQIFEELKATDEYNEKNGYEKIGVRNYYQVWNNEIKWIK